MQVDDWLQVDSRLLRTGHHGFYRGLPGRRVGLGARAEFGNGPPPVSDGGADAGHGADAGSTGQDGGATGLSAPSHGCGAAGAPALALLVALAWAARRRRG